MHARDQTNKKLTRKGYVFTSKNRDYCDGKNDSLNEGSTKMLSRQKSPIKASILKNITNFEVKRHPAPLLHFHSQISHLEFHYQISLGPLWASETQQGSYCPSSAFPTTLPDTHTHTHTAALHDGSMPERSMSLQIHVPSTITQFSSYWIDNSLIVIAFPYTSNATVTVNLPPLGIVQTHS